MVSRLFKILASLAFGIGGFIAITAFFAGANFILVLLVTVVASYILYRLGDWLKTV